MAPGRVARLTYNPGQNLLPDWSPTGREIVYTAERVDRADRDRCLAFLGETGGAVTRYACRTTAADDSLNVMRDAAFSPDTQIAYVRLSNILAFPRITPDAQQLVVAPLRNPAEARAALVLPARTAWGSIYEAVTYISWLGSSQLVMIGDSVRYPRACPVSCPPDTVRTGIEIVTLDVSGVGGSGGLALVPGTQGATSVARGATPDTIYFTLAGDSRVHRFVFSTSQSDIAFDFGAGRLVRDVRIARGRLVAIVDGHARDGGDIHVVDLATGADSMVAQFSYSSPLWFEHPALSPDGLQVVAEGRDLILTPIFSPDGMFVIGVDTTSAAHRNLWLVTLP